MTSIRLADMNRKRAPQTPELTVGPPAKKGGKIGSKGSQNLDQDAASQISSKIKELWLGEPAIEAQPASKDDIDVDPDDWEQRSACHPIVATYPN